MAAADADAEQIEEQNPQGRLAALKGRRKLLLLGGVPVLLLLIGAALLLLDPFGLRGGDTDAAGHGAPASQATYFYDLPEMLVNLDSTGARPSFLKLQVALELREPDAASRLEPLLPRIVDAFQVYLRQLRVEDLNGSAGMLRLKEELLRRVNLAVAPMTVESVLFKEIIVQ